jgi:hypothetical protein
MNTDTKVRGTRAAIWSAIGGQKVSQLRADGWQRCHACRLKSRLCGMPVGPFCLCEYGVSSRPLAEDAEGGASSGLWMLGHDLAQRPRSGVIGRHGLQLGHTVQ